MDQKKLGTIALIVLTNILGAQLIIPVFPLYAKDNFSATIIQIGLFTTAYFAAQFIAAPILGRLSDRYGRRPVLIGSQIGTVFSFIMFIVAIPVGGWLEKSGFNIPGLNVTGGLLWLYAARILDGITGGNITTAQAYVSDISTPENRARSLGMLGAAFGTGFIFGPAVGGFLSGFSQLAPFYAAALISLLSVILTILILDESLTAERRAKLAGTEKTRLSIREIFSQPALPILLAISFFETLSFASIPPNMTLYAEAVLFPETATSAEVALGVGLMFSVIGVVMVITQGVLLKHIVKFMGERRVVLMGQVVVGIVFIMIPLAKSPFMMGLLFAPFAFGRGVAQPSEQSLVTRFGTDQTRGQLLGLFQSMASLGFIFGPLWSSPAFQNIGPQSFWRIGAAIMIPAILLAVALNRQEPPDKKTTLRKASAG